MKKYRGLVASTALILGMALVAGCPVPAPVALVTLTATVQGSGYVTPTGQFATGSAVNVAAIPAQGWQFDHWSGDLSGSANPASLAMADDKAVTAVFVQIAGEGEGEGEGEVQLVTLTANADGEGVVTPSGQFVKGATTNVAAVADPGWLFDHWTGDLSGNTNPAPLLLDGDKTVTGVFTKIPIPDPAPASKDPGLNVEIKGVVIPADLRPEVTFTATDNKSVALRKIDLTSVRFMIDYLETPATGSTARYISYITTNDTTLGSNPPPGASKIQATMDGAQNAGVTDNRDGTFTYKFKSALPATYTQTATHAVGGQMSRVFSATGEAEDNLTYYANPIFTFRPDGQPVTATREIVTTEACNGCHTRIAFHGGGRRETALCILCHTTQSTDAGTGNSLDLPQMIHKIHRGQDLPSVVAGTPYQIIGHGNTVNDYSTVVFPQDVRNCTVCHNGAAQSDAYLKKPTAEGCGSCHDSTWFGDPGNVPTGSTAHLGGPQADNQFCAVCHTPTAPGVSPIAAAHLIPEKNPLAPGLNLSIVGEPVVNPDDGTLQAVVHVEKGDGSPVTALSQLYRLGLTVAYPATDYQTYANERMIPSGSSAVPGIVDASDAINGNYGYTFKAKLPVGTHQTFALGAEARMQFKLGTDPTQYTQTPAANPVKYFTTDGSAPVERRVVVDEAQCLKCHDKLELHGGSRVSVEYCLLCHNSTTTAGTGAEAASVHFDVMIHKLHTGENLEQPYPFGTEIRFPGDRRECTICHLPDTANVPLPSEATPTVVTLSAGPPPVTHAMLPTAAACTGCHDAVDAVAHAETNGVFNSDPTTGGVEACELCHGAGALYDIAVMHKIEP